jgi:hypothetical protein
MLLERFILRLTDRTIVIARGIVRAVLGDRDAL